MYASQPTAAVVSGPQATAIVANPQASAAQLSVANSLGISGELANCVSTTKQVPVEHKHYTVNAQNTNRTWMTKETSFVPQVETLSASFNQLPDINIVQGCPPPCPPPVAVAPPPCATVAPPCAPPLAVAPPCHCCWTTGSIPNGGSQISGIGPGYGGAYLGVGTVGGAVIGGPQVAYGATLYRAF